MTKQELVIVAGLGEVGSPLLKILSRISFLHRHRCGSGRD